MKGKTKALLNTRESVLVPFPVYLPFKINISLWSSQNRYAPFPLELMGKIPELRPTPNIAKTDNRPVFSTQCDDMVSELLLIKTVPDCYHDTFIVSILLNNGCSHLWAQEPIAFPWIGIVGHYDHCLFHFFSMPRFFLADSS